MSLTFEPRRAVSRTRAAFKDAGILTDRREGRWVYYSLNSEAIEEMEKLLGSLRAMNGRHQAGSKCCE